MPLMKSNLTEQHDGRYKGAAGRHANKDLNGENANIDLNGKTFACSLPGPGQSRESSTSGVLWSPSGVPKQQAGGGIQFNFLTFRAQMFDNN